MLRPLFVAPVVLLAGLSVACPPADGGNAGEGEGEGEGDIGEGEGEGDIGEGEGEGEGDVGEGEGEDFGFGSVTWTSNGTTFTEPLPAGSTPFVVQGDGASALATLSFAGRSADFQNSLQISMLGPFGSATIPPGDYPCVEQGFPQMTAGNAGAAAQSGTAGSSCVITLVDEAANGTTFSGTFIGTLNGVNGGPNQEITNGSFTIIDQP